MKKLYLLKTFGCRVNQAESIQIEKNLQKAGFLPAGKKDKPDIIIINSCVVTQKAEKEVKQLACSLKRKCPDSLLVVTGCAANHWQSKGIKRPEADLLLPNQQKSQISQLIISKFNQLHRHNTLVYCGDNFWPNFSPYWQSGRALVKIQDGCDNFCAYCLVPYLRSEIISKPINQVVKEIKSLIVKRDIKEVVLCGINLELYEYDPTSLLKQILSKTKIKRIRFGSINVGAFSKELIKLYQKEFQKFGVKTRLCRHFHIPLQSGSNKVLKRMRRKYTRQKYTQLVKKIKQELPGVTISTDLIVGFPGENEIDFKKSLALIRKCQFIKVHLFRFSPRRETLAEKMINDKKWQEVSATLIKQRANKARQAAKAVRQKEIKRFWGQKLAVLFEREAKPGVFEGYSDNFIKIKKRSREDLVGKIKIVTPRGIRFTSLEAVFSRL